VGLVQEIRGELDPSDLAARAIGFLARYLEAPAAALYGWSELDEVLGLLAQHARAGEVRGAEAPTFKRGEGLVGQAAQGQDLVVIADPPPDYLRIRSGLGEAGPRALVLLPLTNGGQLTGVLELAVFKPWSAASGELLLQVRETLSVALGMAQARSAMRSLLGETQRQAARLAAQEEELRATNEELQAQQEELQQANEELSHQTHELEAQRRTLEASNHELDLAQRTLQQKANELVTVSAYKSQFLANMSHELRTPLNSMLLLSNLLAENESGNLSEKQVQYSRTIHGAGTDLLGLINQVLDLAKIESGKQELSLAPMPLRGLLDHAHHVFEPLAREKQLEFRATLDPSLPEQIVTDGKRVVQVLNNLLGNAIKFTTRGSVALHLGRPAPDARLTHPGLLPGQTLALQVVDTGVGIAPEHQQRVFAPFEQVEAASDRRFGGTGLGLSIARELAGLLGGELQLHSAPGQGSRFVCFLPLVPPPAAAAGAAAVETPAVQAPSSVALAPSTGHLLLIEDDPVFAETFAEVIRSQGVECQLARDGQTGLEMARKHRPAGIILDVKLPGLDGWRVMDLLDTDPATADIPVYFVSALDGRERGMAMGAVGYLNKPATRDDLLRVVGSLVPGPASRPCRILVVDADAGAADLAQALELEGFQVRRVDRAGAARAALQAERFDCVVIDPALPDVDGLEFLRSLDPQPTVLVHTARALTRDEVQRLQAYEAVVLKEGASGERLLEELRLFVRRLNQAPGRRRPAAAAAELGSVRLDGRKLLVVDDDMRTVFALSALLRAKGAEVLVADTGLAALELLDANTDVEAVLMDIMMPEMDGYEAMRRIRADGRFAELPILSLTAKAMKGDEQRSLEAGATAYLPKPIDADRLLQVLGGWFSGKRAHGS
jgi:signal transduction histidine kinase/CheY-like chemotaxis protein